MICVMYQEHDGVSYGTQAIADPGNGQSRKMHTVLILNGGALVQAYRFRLHLLRLVLVEATYHHMNG